VPDRRSVAHRLKKALCVCVCVCVCVFDLSITSKNYLPTCDKESKGTFSMCVPCNAYGEGKCIAPPILNLGARWQYVVSFMPWPLCRLRNSPRYPFNRKHVDPRAGVNDSKKPPLSLRNQNKTPVSSIPSPSHYTDYANPSAFQLGWEFKISFEEHLNRHKQNNFHKYNIYL
jgi:hypothetical protein